MRVVESRAPLYPAATPGRAPRIWAASVLLACSMDRPSTHAESYTWGNMVLGSRPSWAASSAASRSYFSPRVDRVCTLVSSTLSANSAAAGLPSSASVRVDDSEANHTTSPRAS